MTKPRNPLRQLRDLGQSPWCDQLSRQMLESGQLRELIFSGVMGLTSNPTIFQKALAEGSWYDDQIRTGAVAGRGVSEIYEDLAVRDIQAVADLLRPVYEVTDRAHGYVSLEVSPALAHDTAGSLVEARRLWRAVARPNLMVKIPGTAEGLPAITTLLSEGMNVNVTLIFGLARYREVLEAHAAGLARAQEDGFDVARIASVASFFVSRVDTLVDRRLEALTGSAGEGAAAQALRGLRGTAAIANAKMARTIWEKWQRGDRMRGLLERGAMTQRLLWASTSAKNPAYRDVLYVEELIGLDTVNTMPVETIDAFMRHGVARGATLDGGFEEALDVFMRLAAAGVDMEVVAAQLETDGVRLFPDSFARLLDGIEAKIAALRVATG
jgi:transaldolase